MNSVYSVYIINGAGSLIYDTEFTKPTQDVEQTFGYPLDIVLKSFDGRLVVDFGARDAIKVGHYLLAVNGRVVKGQQFDDDGSEVLKWLNDQNNYPAALKFGKVKLSTNDKILLASMFHSLYAFSCQLSPNEKSSGIQLLEAETFKLHCKQTLTGMKFIVLTSPSYGYVEQLLNKIYELYADYALKNPFYSLDQRIKCELFDDNLMSSVSRFESGEVLG